MDAGLQAGYRFVMTTELIVLAWGCVLALVHIMAAAQVKTRQYGSKWNVGPRDEELPPPGPMVGRLSRAQANFFETFPLMIAAVLIVSVGALRNETTALGAWLWLGGRIAYLPLYALGIPYLRSLAWGVATAGIVMVLWPALAAAV
jgi:uncharacterized MAPEG superfamily protein